MRIVAIGAFHQPFVHFMMKRLTESRLHIAVAAKAELWLRSLEQVRVLPRHRHRGSGPLQRIADARVWLHRIKKTGQRVRLLHGARGWRRGIGRNRYRGETMDAMTARAADAGFGVIRAKEVRVSARMAL